MPPNVSQVTKKIDLPSNRIIDLVNNAEIIKWLQIFKLDILSCITKLENKGTINLDESHESLFNTKKNKFLMYAIICLINLKGEGMEIFAATERTLTVDTVISQRVEQMI